MPPNCLSRLGMVVALTTSVGVQAAEWALDPHISARTRYDDNYRLNTSNELTVWETAILPKLTFSRTTERDRIAGTAGLNLRRFDEDGLDRNDRFLKFESSRLFETSRVGLNADYTRDSSLDSELVGDQLFLDRVARERWSISPSWTYTLSQTTQLNASYQFVDLSYPDISDNQQYTGYQYHVASLGMSYGISPTTRLTSQLNASRSERDDNTLRSNNVQISLGLEHAFSARLTGAASVGTGRTESKLSQDALTCSGILLPGFFFGTTGTVCVDPDSLTIIPFTTATQTSNTSSSSSVYNASLDYLLETGKLSMSMSRSITPYTNGSLVSNDRLRLSGTHQLSHKVESSLSLDWYKTTSTDDTSGILDRSTFSIRPGLHWNFERDWSLSASYRYFKQDYEGRADAAVSNSAELTLTYRWPKIAISR